VDAPIAALMRTMRVANGLQRVVAAPGALHERAATALARVLALPAPRVLPELAAPAPDEPSAEASARLAAELDLLAAESAGAHVAVFVARSTAAIVVARALGLDAEAGPRRFDPVAAAAVGIDWPARWSALLHPAVVGVGLDWVPPGPPVTSARFPGGPGSAPSGRR
jgi:hypothetical protein